MYMFTGCNWVQYLCKRFEYLDSLLCGYIGFIAIAKINSLVQIKCLPLLPKVSTMNKSVIPPKFAQKANRQTKQKGKDLIRLPSRAVGEEL